MNDYRHFRSLAGVILIAAFVLSACAPVAAPTPTPALTVIPATTIPTPTSIPATSTPTPAPIPATSIPTLTPIPPTSTSTPIAAPRLSKSPELILAINKPPRESNYPGHVVYTLPEMDKVLLASELVYYKNLSVDIYYPPNYQFKAKLPIVILSHGFEEPPDMADKDIDQHIDWAKLIAASGIIAISAQAGFDPMPNSYIVLDFLASNADFLGLDLTRIGYWACSAQGYPMFKAFQDKDLPYREGFKAAAFFYLQFGRTTDPNIWPKNISLFVVKAGKDTYTSASMMDNIVAQARSNKIPMEYIELEGAPHGFDVSLNTQASKDTIEKALQFFKSKLLP